MAIGSSVTVTQLDAATQTDLTTAVAAVVQPNIIDNGNFNIWQRNTTFTAIASGALAADRWQYPSSVVAVHTISRSTDVPTVAESGTLSNYSLLIDCTTIDASITGSDIVGIRQIIEGYDFQKIAQRTFTLSFWVKATKTGIYCVGFRNSGADRSYIAEYTINTTATWEKKTITVSASPSAGTWDYTNGLGLTITFTLAVGATLQTTAGSWATGNYLGSANQVNACDDVANNFQLSQVKLEPGSVATTFIDRPFNEEFAKCQRYYETSFNHGTVVPTATTLVGICHCVVPSNTVADAQSYGKINFAVSKKATPTVTIYPYTTPTNTSRVSDGTGTDLAASSGVSGWAGMCGFSVYNNTGGNITTTGTEVMFHWAAVSDF